MRVTFIFDIRQLKFRKAQGRETQRLTFVAALLDDHGAFVAGREGEMTLALKPDTFARLAETGVSGVVYIPATAGNYSVRGVVQEDVSGKLAASTQHVEIH